MGRRVSKIKENVVYAWMFEQLGAGKLTESEIMVTFDCKDDKEWLYRIKELSGKADDLTPIEILRGCEFSDAAK